MQTAVVLVIAYLIGTFPSAVLVARREGHDPTVEGSGNPGASNVYRVAGRKAGITVFAADLAKGALSCGVALLITDSRMVGLAATIAAVVGHTLPPWGRRGGKGVAAAAGGLLVMYPALAVVALAGWVLLARLMGMASGASMLVAVLFPVAVGVAGNPIGEALTVAAMSTYIVIRHSSNIVRIVRGEERSRRTRDGG